LINTMNFAKSYIPAVLVIALLSITLIVKIVYVQSYSIQSGMMQDTIENGDFILVETFTFTKRAPRQGDVVVFEYPENTSKIIITRVIGTPGDTVEVKEKKVYVNGQPYDNPHEVHKEKDLFPREQNPRDNMGPVAVPSGACFVMGDNRDRSYDSRFWGFVKSDKIKGLAFIKYWSWDDEHSQVRWGNIGALID